jgi:hypothetical protein
MITLSQKTLLLLNKAVLKTPFIPYSIKIKTYVKIMIALKKSGFRGV